MQDFDTLRDRVEATTEMLKSAQADRQDQTESLVAILRQLEEKHAAQAQQLTYYKKRVAPLEQANRQLAALMENLLDLIDGGFGEDSLMPLRDASNMAAAMLESDLFMPEQEAAARPAGESDDEAAQADVADLQGADVDEVAAAGPDAGDEEDEDPPADAGEYFEAVADDATEFEDDADADPGTAEPDLEMEEDALLSLDELLDLASEESPPETVAFADVDPDSPVMADREDPTEPVEAIAGDSPAADAVAGDGIIDDGGFEAEFLGDEIDRPVPCFEDVSEATLELETEEDAAAGTDDLPDVVKDAMVGREEDGAVGLVPEIPGMDGETGSDAAAEDDLATIAALAQAIEEETANDDARPPAPSDIRALLLRVERLAKKAEAMRMAQGASEQPHAAPKAKTEKSRKQAGAAA
jgi:hypothetical protein